MADMSATATRETGGTKSILRLIRSTPASNPETGALRAEVEGLRLALSIAQEALREERSDKEHWRDEAKQVRQLLAGQKPEPKIINVAAPEAPHTVEAPTLGPALETEPEKRPSSEMTPAQIQQRQRLSAGGAGYSPKLERDQAPHLAWRHRHAPAGQATGRLGRRGRPGPRARQFPASSRVRRQPTSARIHAQLDARRTNRHSR
jgi:hypothetical protein